MTPLQKTVIVLAMLAGAICAALPFLRPSSPETAQRSADGEQLQLRGVDTDEKFVNPISASEGTPAPAELAVAPVAADLEAPVVSRLPSLGRISPPPLLETGYPQELGPAVPLGAPSFGAPEELPSSESSGDEIVAAPRRRHKIRDGDTLESLARRYLGSQNRGDEIYAANRNVLPQRDLLPIGIEIIIPDQSASP